jgi:hypothetical protein
MSSEVQNSKHLSKAVKELRIIQLEPENGIECPIITAQKLNCKVANVYNNESAYK